MMLEQAAIKPASGTRVQRRSRGGGALFGGMRQIGAFDPQKKYFLTTVSENQHRTMN